MDKNLFLKNMEEMIQIAKTNGNQIDHKELLDYFSDYELNEEAKKLLIASFVEAGIRVLGVDEAQIVAEEEAKEKADISEEEQGADRFDIYLDEKKVQLKEDKTNPDIISYGFGEYRTIQDCPIRGRATYLHVRKRKWLDKSSNEIFSYDWDLSEFDGTRLNSEFVSFLKEGD